MNYSIRNTWVDSHTHRMSLSMDQNPSYINFLVVSGIFLRHLFLQEQGGSIGWFRRSRSILFSGSLMNLFFFLTANKKNVLLVFPDYGEIEHEIKWKKILYFKIYSYLLISLPNVKNIYDYKMLLRTCWFCQLSIMFTFLQICFYVALDIYFSAVSPVGAMFDCQSLVSTCCICACWLPIISWQEMSVG